MVSKFIRVSWTVDEFISWFGLAIFKRGSSVSLARIELERQWSQMEAKIHETVGKW